MNQKESLEIIRQAINVGFKAGVYSLEDAQHIINALLVVSTNISEEPTNS